jgi:hypothetical protein
LIRRLRAALALAAVLLTAAPPVHAGLADRVGATFGLIEADFIQTFQPMEGLVVAIDNDEIFLDVNSGNGAQIGQEYTIYRKGEPFVHPTTGKPLGRYETVLGYAQIRRVQDRFSVAAFVPSPDRPRPRPEDGARITRGRIKVAITPVLDMTNGDADVRRVPFLIATSLERSKRFQVVDPLTVGDMFATGSVRVEEVLARPERAVAMAKNLEVAGWIIPMLLERRGVVYLDLTYISAVTGAPIFSRRQAVLPPSDTEEQRFPWEPRAED